MALFDAFIDFVVTQIEGEHEPEDPKDPGGDTWYGISRRSYPHEPWPPTRERAIEIYKADFWDACQADHLPARLACAVVDAAINEGVESAIKILQHTLGVDVDGVLGPQTLAAALARSPRPLARAFLAHRLLAYSTLTNWGVYGYDWCYRVMQLAGFIEQLP